MKRMKMEFQDLARKLKAALPGLSGILLRTMRFIGLTFIVAVGFYILFAVVFDTADERAIRKSISSKLATYEVLDAELDGMDLSIDSLSARDESIYRTLFNAPIPEYLENPFKNSGVDFSGIESENEKKLQGRAYNMMRRAELSSGNVSASFDSLEAVIFSNRALLRKIPSIAPVAGFSPGQIGASVGRKYNPFFKTVREHTGLDIIAPAGTKILASADGLVTVAKNSGSGDGKVIILLHAGNVKTVYKHLGEMLVTPGMIVRKGAPIAVIGESGRSFAPHLHYEVLVGDKYMDPVHYLFTSVPDINVFEDIFIVAATAGQSME